MHIRVAALVSLIIGSTLACGGNVLVDGSSSAGSGGAATASSSSTATSASTGGGGAALPDCDGLGRVDVGLACPTEGMTCAMHVCCDGFVVCSGGVWTAAGPKCFDGCTTCGAGLDCDHGAVCVTDQVQDIRVGYRCELSPCPAGERVDCTCGATLCDGLECIGPTATGLGCTDGTR